MSASPTTIPIRPDVRRRRIPLGEVTLEVDIAGPPNGPAVVLLHGFPETPDMWSPLSARLNAQGFRTVAPLQRGYGDSSHPHAVSAYDIDRATDDIVQLAAALGHKRYLVIGHDWGGAVGWRLASRLAPGLAGVMAISAPDPSVWRRFLDEDPDQRSRSRYLRLFAWPILPEILIRRRGFAALVRAFGPDGVGASTLAAYRAVWRRPGSLTGMINWYRALLARPVAGPPPTPALAPVLFVYGDADPYLAGTTAAASAALIVRGEAVAIAGGGIGCRTPMPRRSSGGPWRSRADGSEAVS